MSRQPVSGAGAAVGSPSGAAARASAPLPSPAPSPQRYRALRARYNALLVTLYERTDLTLREIALLAGRTERAVQMLVRALGCRPRKGWCRPGTSIGLRRGGPRPPPLNAPATRRVTAAFAEVASALAASPQMRAASELQRATAKAQRRAARTQMRVMLGAARELRSLAAAMEDLAAIRPMPTSKRKRSRARQPANTVRPSRPDLRPELCPDLPAEPERARLEPEARLLQAHPPAEAAKAVAAAEPPAFSPDIDRRINEIAARYNAEPPSRPQPRVRRL
jgi:hypothetical protein